jgi:hypothetical protein
MKTKHLPLAIGIALPVVFIAIISVAIFLPTLFIKPEHNFIYTLEDTSWYNQNYEHSYKVEGDRIVIEPIISRNSNVVQKGSPGLFLYDVKNNTSERITLEEAQRYNVSPGPSSPDGYTVGYEYGHAGIFELFGDSDSQRGYFISSGSAKKKLTGLGADRYTYQTGFRLIGWVK